jgi:hypothetical protein
VRRGSNACTGAHALNQATLPASGTRSTIAHGRSFAVSIGPTGSVCMRIHSSTAGRSTTILVSARATSDGREFALDARSEREERLNLLVGAD